MTAAARIAVETATKQTAVPTWKPRAGRAVLALTILGAGVLWLPRLLATLDYFHVQTVKLEGARFLTPTVIVDALRDTSKSVFDDADRYRARVESIPLVARATIRRQLPGTLIVRIVERTPVAIIATKDGFRGVDSAGTTLPVEPSAAGFDAPLVLAPIGARDTAADRRLFQLLGSIRAADPALFDAIDEARRISATEWQLTTTRQRVRIAPDVTLARLADIFPIEQDLARRRIRAAEIDLRYRNHAIARLP